MPAGRPRSNPELQKLAGNPGKRPIKKTATPKGALQAPKELRPEALAVWKSVVGAMPAATYAATDAFILSTLCEAVADYFDACKALREQGRYIAGSTGQLVLSPAVKDKNEQARLIYTLSQRLYLDPVARQALLAGEPGKVEDDEFGGLIN